MSPRTERIENEGHRHVYATEQLSYELADRDEPMPEGEALKEAVDAWLAENPDVVVGATVVS